MKILFLIESLGSGGAERQLVYLMNSLFQMGHKVHLMTWIDNNHYKNTDIPGIVWEKANRSSRRDLRIIVGIYKYVKKNQIKII